MSYTWKDMCVAVKDTKEKGEPSKLIINILNDIVKTFYVKYYNMSQISIFNNIF